jgi:hypothetical protein
MTDLRFWPLGIGRSRSPLAEAGDRLLIVSPFLTLGRLEALANERSEVMLVSTGFALAALNRRPRGVRKFYTLQDRAMAETDSDQEVQADSGAEAIAQFDLHAKLYVSESGRDAHIWTGSANATDAAFSQNVEFLVELTGPRKRFGIDVLLEPATGETRFINLLQDASSQVAIQPEEPALKALEDRLNRLRNAIAAGSFEVRVNRVDDLFSLKLVFSGASPLTVEDMTLRCWPVTVSASNAVGINQLEPGCVAAAFDGLPVKSITSFIGFDLHGRAAGNECHQQFVLNAALVGAPEGRREQVLRAAVGDNRKMLRFLWLLLADEGVDVPEMDGAGGETRGTGNGHTSALPGGLFEMLLRTLDRNPARLDHLSGLLKELRHGADGADLLPAGFDAVWEPIWRQRERLGQHVPAVQR